MSEEETNTASAQQVEVSGRSAGRPAGPVLRVLMGLTGVSLVCGLGKLFARYVFGWRRDGRLSLDGDNLTLTQSTKFAGKVVKNSTESFAGKAVLSVRLEQRYPFLPTLVGMTGLGLGIIVGIIWILDGIQGEFTPWILSGVGILLLGVLLDLALTALASSLPGTATLSICLPDRGVVRLIGCEPQGAARLLTWVHNRKKDDGD